MATIFTNKIKVTMFHGDMARIDLGTVLQNVEDYNKTIVYLTKEDAKRLAEGIIKTLETDKLTQKKGMN